MKTLLTLAISIAIFCDPLYTNGSPLLSDSDGIQSKMDYQDIESTLGVSPNKEGLFRIDDVYFTAEEIKKNFGIGLGDRNGQPDESKRWPKGKKYPVEECQSVQITLSGGALAKQGSRQGVYVKAAKVNGKLSWTKGSHALWWAPNQYWIVGSTIGGNSGGLLAHLHGPPYSSMSNQWEYYAGNSVWVKPINEIIVKCTSLETVGKVNCGNHQEDSCADCPQGNGETWCKGDCKWVNGYCLSKVNGTMPVTFHSSVTSDEKVNIKALMDRFNSEMAGCLQFVDRTTETDYVEVNSHDENTDPNGSGGCYSKGLGRNGNGKQVINLKRPSPTTGGCMRNGTIIHEFIHAWGFWHEHTRPDRDSFVEIIEDNITPGKEHNFEKQASSYTFDVPYDGGSVMHYSDDSFGIKVEGVKQTTIEPLPTYDFDPSGFGQRVWMTANDAMKLKKMYMCEPRGGGEFFGPSGVVDSPEWPRQYSNFADSYLKITCDSGEKVKLQFLTFDIEDHPSCQYDWLSITDTPYGDPQAGPYCGSTKPPNYLSASNYAGVYFRSDGIQTAAGFEIKYTCIKDNVSNCKDKKPVKKCKKWKKKGKCKKKGVAKKCKKTCGKC